MKRIVSLVIAVSMVFSMFATVFAAGSYSDLVGDNAKFAAAVAALSELKVDDQPVINGYPDGTFGPEKEVTRAELAKMLVVCLGLGSEVEALATRTVFSDVATSHWAAGWINAAAQSKIIVGYPDGEFKPEKTVTYAEAFTMALRALGYGNVADFEGTWPTSYMLKAVELDLTRDMEGVKSDAASLRGNVAILLWNMLRTPMWRVTEESENAGMTLSNQNRQRMLNVKFPDYTYVEDVYVADVTVTDFEDVLLAIEDDEGNGSAQLRNIDISRLIVGEKVTALAKDGKKGEDATFLTLTPENTIVEGIITKVNDDGDKFTVNDVEYKLDANKGDLPDGVRIAVNEYVVFEVDGKKVTARNEMFVIKNLPVGGTEVEDVKSALRKIKEDSLVIRDGEWIDREDIAEHDVYTKMDDWNGEYWQVASVDSWVTGSFDSYTSEKVDGITSFFVEVDGESYRNVIGADLKAYEGEKNNKNVPLRDLQEKEKDNKYLDQEVEVAVDYLGNPIILYFGEVDELNNGGSFYAVVNGVWEESAKGGTLRRISLVGFDGEGASEDDISEGVDYQLKKNCDYDEDVLDQDALLQADSTPVFVWANFDTDGELIKTIMPLADGMTSGDPEGYKNKYTIMDVGDQRVDNGKVADFKVTNATVMTVTPLKDEDEIVEGYAVAISTGLEDGDELPAGSFIAYDATKKVQKAVYVFLAEEAESTEWLFGMVETYDERSERGISYVTIDGEKRELDEDTDITDFEEGDVVAYTVYKDKVNVRMVVATPMLDGALIIDDETEQETMVFTGDNDPQFDLEDDSDDLKDYKNYKVIEIAVGTEDDNETLTFDDCETKDEKGLLAIDNSEGVRVIISEDENHKYILVFTGLKLDEKTSNGKLVDEEVEPTPDPEPAPESGDESGDPTPDPEPDPQPAPESGDESGDESGERI